MIKWGTNMGKSPLLTDRYFLIMSSCLSKTVPFNKKTSPTFVDEANILYKFGSIPCITLS